MAKISIIICTRNRAGSLAATLDSLQRTHIPAETEIIVADNGSTDQTVQVVERARTEAFPLRLVREPRPGKSRAYNAALAVASGNVLLSTDDDVRFPHLWIGPMTEPIFEQRAAIVQGGVKPAPALARPWLRNSFVAVAAIVDPPPAPAVPDQCIGANMAFSRAVLETVKGFDPTLGPGSAGGLCEDSLFGAMARAAGFQACYAEQGAVEHHFDHVRLQPAGVLDVARRLGRSNALIDYHWHHNERRGTRLRRALLESKLKTRLFWTTRGAGPIPEWHFCYELSLAYERQLSALRGQRRRYGLRQVGACLELGEGAA